jgi:SHAQKYF class myb-like DNA-binding protein
MNSLQAVEISKNDDKSVKSGDVTPTICSKDQEIASPGKKTTPATSISKNRKSSKTEVFVPENRFKLKPEQAYKKETKASRLGKSTGRWTQKEHILFMEGLKIYGKNWKKVESYIGTRTGTQIRSHAQKFFNRIRKEHGAEDPSKYVVENMCDDRIKQLILEHCGEDVSSQNDTPEVLFSITKEKAGKRRRDEGDSTPRSIGTPGSAFKSFKRQEVDEAGDCEDSKIHSSNTILKRPI